MWWRFGEGGGRKVEWEGLREEWCVDDFDFGGGRWTR